MLSFNQFILQTEANKPKPNQSVQDAVAAAKKVARQQRLEQEQQVGRPCSKSWGGRPDTQTSRRKSRQDLQRGSDI